MKTAPLISPRGKILPVLTVVAVLLVLWYGLAAVLNWNRVTEDFASGSDAASATEAEAQLDGDLSEADSYESAAAPTEEDSVGGEESGAAGAGDLNGAADTSAPPTFLDILDGTWSMDRPVLPSPAQILRDFLASTIEEPATSNKSLVYHASVTASATLVGFALGALLGVLLAAGIVHVKALDRSLMPWIVASQTIPILAIAPMIIVVLGNIGITGLVPKAIISMYLCFFPVAIGMVKGLRSPDPMQIDLMRSYNASAQQIFWKLRVPASIPFLFASLKVAVAISLTGAIVGELPTGATSGIGARLLSGSYYGQTVQIWSALFAAALLGMGFVYSIAGIERLVLGRTGQIR